MQPVQSSLCTMQLALSTVVGNKVTETNNHYSGTGLRLGLSEVLRSFRRCLRAQSQGHRLEERDVKGGSGRRSSLRGRLETAIVVQSDLHWNCFNGNTGDTFERRGFPSLQIPSGTELNNNLFSRRHVATRPPLWWPNFI